MPRLLRRPPTLANKIVLVNIPQLTGSVETIRTRIPQNTRTIHFPRIAHRSLLLEFWPSFGKPLKRFQSARIYVIPERGSRSQFGELTPLLSIEESGKRYYVYIGGSFEVKTKKDSVQEGP